MAERALGELVTFRSKDGVHLDGILFLSEDASTTIVHVHGSFGNFYQNHFVRVMARRYLATGMNFLSFNLSCHDGIAEGYANDDEFRYVGGALCEFGRCVDEIAGAMELVAPFSQRVVLQGHSLGCERVLHFILESGHKGEFILLAPCDSYRLQTNWLRDETVEQQIQRLTRDLDVESGNSLLSSSEYGIRQDDWVYSIPISLRAFLSIATGPPFDVMRVDIPPTFEMENRCLVYIGGKDALQTSHPDRMFECLESRLTAMTRVYFADGDHMLSRVEEDVAHRIIEWINAF